VSRNDTANQALAGMMAKEQSTVSYDGRCRNMTAGRRWDPGGGDNGAKSEGITAAEAGGDVSEAAVYR